MADQLILAQADGRQTGRLVPFPETFQPELPIHYPLTWKLVGILTVAVISAGGWIALFLTIERLLR